MLLRGSKRNSRFIPRRWYFFMEYQYPLPWRRHANKASAFSCPYVRAGPVAAGKYVNVYMRMFRAFTFDWMHPIVLMSLIQLRLKHV